VTAKERRKWYSYARKMSEAAALCRVAGHAPFFGGDQSEWFFRAADDMEQCAARLEREL
jgi:hypothetical protein